MSALAEKMRRAREVRVEAGGHCFTVLRPTEGDMARLHGQQVDGLDFMRRFVVGWDLQEIDLVPGGSPVSAAFDAEDFAEWVADHSEVWAPITAAIREAYSAHARRSGDAEKN